MKIQTNQYWGQVCPFCDSKDLETVGLVHMSKGQCCADITRVNQTGFLCGNCKRYHSNNQTKYKYDRAEMRRDVNRLLKFLAKKRE